MAVFPTNAVLVFQLPDGAIAVGDFGNPEVVAKVLTVEASLSVSNRMNDESNELANRVDTLNIKGRVNRAYTNDDPPFFYTPPRLPPEIAPGVKVPCTLTNLDTNETTEGEFVLALSLPSKWGVDKVLGGQLNGYFFVKNVFGGVA